MAFLFTQQQEQKKMYSTDKTRCCTVGGGDAVPPMHALLFTNTAWVLFYTARVSARQQQKMYVWIKQDGVQLEAGMESHQRMVSDKLSVGELMTTQMTALEPIMLVSKLEAVLRRCAHQAFPITNEVDKAFAASGILPLLHCR